MLELNFSPFPVLSTARLELKAITDADAAFLFGLRSDPEVMKYIDRPLATSVEDAIALIRLIDDLIAGNDSISWGIFRKGDPELIGTIGYYRMQPENYRGEVGYLLGTRFHRQGIMSEALIAALDYGFRVMGLHSIEARISPENRASAALLEKSGFAREGHFRENHFYNGKFLDTVVYSLLTPYP